MDLSFKKINFHRLLIITLIIVFLHLIFLMTYHIIEVNSSNIITHNKYYKWVIR